MNAHEFKQEAQRARLIRAALVRSLDTADTIGAKADLVRAVDRVDALARSLARADAHETIARALDALHTDANVWARVCGVAGVALTTIPDLQGGDGLVPSKVVALGNAAGRVHGLVADLDVYTEAQKVVALVASAVLNRLDELGLTPADLARRIGWSEVRVDQVLCGSHSMTFEAMALFALGCGFTWDVQPYEEAS